MRRFSDRHQLQTLSELNVTPLLDLAFVLLIIFMITTPLMENSTELVLPSGDPSSQAADPERLQTVSLRADRQILLNDSPVTVVELQERLMQARATRPDLAVLIRPHKDLPIQELNDLLDTARRAGVRRIGFVTTPRE